MIDEVENLIKECKAKQEELVKLFLEAIGTDKEFEIPLNLSLSHDETWKILESYKFELIEDSFNSNGWDYDWWSLYINRTTKVALCLSGSGYYGYTSINFPEEDTVEEALKVEQERISRYNGY